MCLTGVTICRGCEGRYKSHNQWCMFCVATISHPLTTKTTCAYKFDQNFVIPLSRCELFKYISLRASEKNHKWKLQHASFMTHKCTGRGFVHIFGRSSDSQSEFVSIGFCHKSNFYDFSWVWWPRVYFYVKFRSLNDYIYNDTHLSFCLSISVSMLAHSSLIWLLLYSQLRAKVSNNRY